MKFPGKENLFFLLKRKAALQLLLDSFIHHERTGHWKMRVKEKRESVCCIMPSFIFPAGITDFSSLPCYSKNVEFSVFLFLLVILATIKSAMSPICRYSLLNSVRKCYEFSLPLWLLGPFYSFFSFWSTWKVYSDIPPFFFYYLIPLSTLWCLSILFIDILLFFPSSVLCT